MYNTGTDSSGNAYIDFTSPKSNKLTYTFEASYIANPSSPISSTPTCLIYSGTTTSPTLITSITANTITYVTNTEDIVYLELASYVNGASTTLTVHFPALQVSLGINAVFRIMIPPQTYNYLNYGLSLVSSVSSVTVAATY